jgi:hypothetical protein
VNPGLQYVPSTYDYEAFTAGTCTVKPKSKFQEYIDDEQKRICESISALISFAGD